MRFSHHEIKDLFFAGMILSLAFAILLSGPGIVFSFQPNAVMFFLIAFFTAGIGFLLHELAHKIVAQKYGLRAEFRAFYPMLWLALAFSFFGFIFAAPGAVFIFGFMNREKNGKISVAGPITNIALAVIFLLLILATGIKQGLLGSFLIYGLSINSLLAAFNMIPVMPFDGAKVIRWKKSIYFMTLIVAVLLFIASFFVR